MSNTNVRKKMEKTEGQGTVYPPEYAHVEDKVRAAQERVQQLDEQIKNVPANSKPAPILTPPGFVQPPYFSREKKIGSLEQEKFELKDTTFSQIEQELRDADPKLARMVRDNAREDLFPSEAKKMSVPKKDELRSKPKDIEQSQDLMDSYFSAVQKRGIRDNREIPEKSPKKETTSMSLRFSQGLDYTKATEKLDRSPDSPNEDIDLDTLFPSGPATNEKSNKEALVTPTVNNDVSAMSARFSQGLSYNRVSQKTDMSLEKSSKREIEPDKDY